MTVQKQRTDEELKAQGLERVFCIEVVEGDILEDGKKVKDVRVIWKRGVFVHCTIELEDGYASYGFGKAHSTIIIKFNEYVDYIDFEGK